MAVAQTCYNVKWCALIFTALKLSFMIQSVKRRLFFIYILNISCNYFYIEFYIIFKVC